MRTTMTARITATGAGALLALGMFAAAPPAGASSNHGGHGRNSADAACFTGTGKTQGRSHSDPDGMSNGGADKPGCTGGFDADRDGNNGCGNDADREDDNNGNCGRKKTPPTPPAPEPKVEAQHQSADHTGTSVEAEHDERDDDIRHDRQHGCPGTAGSSTTSTSTTSTTVAGTAVGAAATPSGNCGCVLGSTASVTPAGATLTVSASSPSAAAGTTVSPAATAPDTSATVAGSTGAAGTEVAAADTTTTQPATQVLGETVTRPSSSGSTLPASLPRTGAAIGGLALVGAGLAGTGRLAAFSRRFLRR
jgi:hypothetical protein